MIARRSAGGEAMGLRALAPVVGLISSLAAMPVVAVTKYTAIPLGTLGVDSHGYAINSTGQVTGTVGTGPGGIAPHAFLWSDGVMKDLGTLGGSDSQGYGINDAGQVTGYSLTTGNAASRAFLYSASVMQDLGTLGGRDSAGYGINAAGQVTGWANTSGSGPIGGAPHSFLYSGGTMIDLDMPPSSGSMARNINVHGQVTGGAAVSFDTRAFIYSAGTWTILGTLGGSSSWGTSINYSGQVTGSSDTLPDPAIVRHAFLYSSGTMRDLGTLGGTFSYGYGINASADIVGEAGITSGASRAFLWSGGSMYDLNTLVVSGLSVGPLVRADGINDRGQIVATGCIPFSFIGCMAYRLDPIAETAIPTLSREALGVMALLVLASGLLLRSRRKQ
jgi:probable HAF family extracellular repeat protein